MTDYPYQKMRANILKEKRREYNQYLGKVFCVFYVSELLKSMNDEDALPVYFNLFHVYLVTDKF